MKSNKKLILLEGLPGSGKSTTSQWLHRRFSQCGVSAHWYYELAANHPLTHHCDLKKVSREELVKQCLRTWSSFLSSEVTDYDVIIIDSGFFQKNVMLMMNLDIDRKEILRYSKQVERRLNQFNPHLVYLNQNNVGAHISSTYFSRGKIFEDALTDWSTSTQFSLRKKYKGLEGSIAYWCDYKNLCDRIFSECHLNKVVIDVSEKRWLDYQSTLSSLLGIPEYRDTGNEVKQSGVVTGKYLKHGSNSYVEVRRRAGMLTITNLLDNLERESVMISNGGDSYDIRGHDVELLFQRDKFGKPAALSVTSSWTRIDGCYFEKVH